MTPREIIRANIECRCDGRIGFNFARVDGRMDDFIAVGCEHDFQSRRWIDDGMEYYSDLWGNIWRRIVGKSESGEIFKPVLDTWDDLDTLVLPDLGESRFFESAVALGATNEDHFRYGHFWGIGWVLTIPESMRRMDRLFIDMIENEDKLQHLLDRVVDVLEGIIVRYGEAGLDGIMFGEDLGVQDRLLFGRERWNRIFRKHYERLTAKAHSFGMKVIQHSCGYNWELLEDLCSSGIDCLQFDQPTIYDLPQLADTLTKLHVGLFSPCDIQRVLPTGDRALITQECRRLVELFRGGLIVKNYPDLHGIGVEPEWDEWAYQAFVEAGT